MIQEFYEKIITQYQIDGIKIVEVAPEVLKMHNSHGGIIHYNCNGGSFHQVLILIDITFDPELKLNVLLHELGHFEFWKSIGCEKLGKFKKDLENWEVLNEFKAFKFQLEKIYEIALLTEYAILKNTMNRFIERQKNDPNQKYRQALGQIFNEIIWQNSVEITKVEI